MLLSQLSGERCPNCKRHCNLSRPSCAQGGLIAFERMVALQEESGGKPAMQKPGTNKDEKDSPS